MQTFLPHPDYAASAYVLDRQRLGVQRVDNLQIMTALLMGTGFVDHPATLMWRRYEWALMEYQRAICREWVSRGRSDTYLAKTEAIFDRYERLVGDKAWPYWTGSERLHMSHQSALLREDYVYYIQSFPGAPIDMEMVFPEALNEYDKINLTPWWIPKEPF